MLFYKSYSFQFQHFLLVLSEEATMKKEKPLVFLNVDLKDVLTKVGVFGPWQLRTVILLMIASFIGGKTRNDKASSVKL